MYLRRRKGRKGERTTKKERKINQVTINVKNLLFFPEKEQKDQMSQVSKNNLMIDRGIN